MQGDGGECSVIDALDAIALRDEEFDAVVIIRGGGSTSDLALFDSYRIASHIAQFPLPIITGIGHDKDISVSDMVAHTSCKTPTAVATLLVEMADIELSAIEGYAEAITREVENTLQREGMRLYTLSNDIERLATTHINSELNRLSVIQNSLRGRIEIIFNTESERLSNIKRILGSYSIDNILKLGFAVVRSSDKAVRSVDESVIGDSIDIELIDGVLNAEVMGISKIKD
jgi:exodeoxyribonuclease VII large subunit